MVVLCAEDDDLELVALAHGARQRGIEVEVHAGLDCEPERVIATAKRARASLLVVFHSEHVCLQRALEAKNKLQTQSGGVRVVVFELDPSRFGSHLGLFERHLGTKPRSSNDAFGPSVFDPCSPGILELLTSTQSARGGRAGVEPGVSGAILCDPSYGTSESATEAPSECDARTRPLRWATAPAFALLLLCLGPLIANGYRDPTRTRGVEQSTALEPRSAEPEVTHKDPDSRSHSEFVAARDEETPRLSVSLEAPAALLGSRSHIVFDETATLEESAPTRPRLQSVPDRTGRTPWCEQRGPG